MKFEESGKVDGLSADKTHKDVYDEAIDRIEDRIDEYTVESFSMLYDEKEEAYYWEMEGRVL
jgi:hypothetical protein